MAEDTIKLEEEKNNVIQRSSILVSRSPFFDLFTKKEVEEDGPHYQSDLQPYRSQSSIFDLVKSTRKPKRPGDVDLSDS